MKKGIIPISKILFLSLIFLMLLQVSAKAQVVNESTRKKFSIGVGMFTDIWTYNQSLENPADINFRTINQGFQTFATYNLNFGQSDFGFSVGLGFRAQNMYGNFFVNTENPAYTRLTIIPDSLDEKRAKICLPYLELPAEFRFKSKSKVSVGIGFKVAYLLPAHYKYVGEDYININYSSDKTRVKFRDIPNIQDFSYGPTVRIGYRWFNVASYFSISKLFEKNKGPEMYPISIGFILMPY
jgi:hypothetical protein